MAFTMSSAGVPIIDWSPLANLGKVYETAKKEADQRAILAELGNQLQSGDPNYREIAGKALTGGNADLGMSLLKLGEAQRKQALEQEAAKEFIRMLTGGGTPAPAPTPASPPAENRSDLTPAMQPTTPDKPLKLASAASLDVPASYTAREVVPSSPKVWGDKEAEAAGIYEKPPAPAPTQMAQAPAPVATPQLQEPASPEMNGMGLSGRVLKLIAAGANPNLPAAQRDMAKTLLSRELDNSKLPDGVKRYLFAKGQGYTGSFLEFETALRKSGATNVNVGDNSKEFDKEFDKKAADRFGKYIDNADAARRKLVDIDNMREISTRLGSQGAAAGVKEAIGPYAEALGIKMDGLSDIQAYTQIIQRLAPQQRAPGSGSTSDIEFKGFIKSLPGLSQNPAAREVGLNTMEALARDEIARGEIASKVSTGELTRVQGEKALRALPDPMKGFKEWRTANPQLYNQALKGQVTASANAGAAAAPPAGMPPNARLAPDGNYYIPDPARPGKYLQVR